MRYQNVVSFSHNGLARCRAIEIPANFLSVALACWFEGAIYTWCEFRMLAHVVYVLVLCGCVHFGLQERLQGSYRSYKSCGRYRSVGWENMQRLI